MGQHFHNGISHKMKDHSCLKHTPPPWGNGDSGHQHRTAGEAATGATGGSKEI